MGVAVKPRNGTPAPMMRPTGTAMPPTRPRHEPGTSEARPKHRVFENVHEASAPKSSVVSETGVSPSDRVLERGIHIGPWTITVMHGSIANAVEVDQLSDLLGVTPPEMPFPRNALVLQHAPSGFSYCFDATRALECVDGVNADVHHSGIHCAVAMNLTEPHNRQRRNSSQSAIKVAYAKEWGESRRLQPSAKSSASNDEAASHITEAKQYDWTYSNTWPGMSGASQPPMLSDRAHDQGVNPWRDVFQLATDPARDRIPVERLGPNSGEPILFYDDVMLYEDELGDNGSSMLNVKVFLVLQRFFLRVDDVMFRVFDTRIYCSFAPTDGEPIPAGAPSASTSLATDKSVPQPTAYPRVIRECRGTEATYAEVKRCLVPHRAHDLTQLTNVNWVAETLERMQMQKLRAAYAKGAQAYSSVAPTQERGAAPVEGAAIVGEVDETSLGWEGDGHCIHVAVLRPPT